MKRKLRDKIEAQANSDNDSEKIDENSAQRDSELNRDQLKKTSELTIDEQIRLREIKDDPALVLRARLNAANQLRQVRSDAPSSSCVGRNGSAIVTGA